MILAFDIDNTSVTIGVLDKKQIFFTAEFSTNYEKTPTEYAVMIKNILDMRGVKMSDIEGSIISSVVPLLVNTFKDVMSILGGTSPLIVGPGLKTGVNIAIGDPSELGAGLVVTAAAAKAKYEGPLIIIDLGTATTLSVINRRKEFIGVVIYPGAILAFNSLSKNTAQLPQVSFDKPAKVIGDRSLDSMQSGIIYGNASMIDGMIERIEEELGEKTTHIATGIPHLCRGIIPCCKHEILIEEKLSMEGLRLIYYKNSKNSR